MATEQNRFTVEGREELRELMDPRLPRAIGHGRPEEGPRTGTVTILPLRTGKRYADGGETGCDSVFAAPAGRISCLNPQALSRGSKEVQRRKVDRYFHDGRQFNATLRVTPIPKSMENGSPENCRKVLLNVHLKREVGPKEYLPRDMTVFPEGGWGSSGKGNRAHRRGSIAGTYAASG